MRRWALATVLVVLAAFACGGAPAQIVDYSPERGSKDVSTLAPIHITFDHDVAEASVASRLHLIPATSGEVHWLSQRKLAYEHSRLATSTTYDVILEAGYRDTAGNVYSLRHHWSFSTEGAPNVATSSPADGDVGTDPSDYVTLDFTHAMDEGSLKSAITFSPQVPFSVRLDPSDNRRAIVAPDSLLDADTTYRMVINTSALDVDGNQIELVRTVTFTTGPVRPLRHWIAFATQDANGVSGGLWIVNERGFPRHLLDVTALTSYSWSPDGGQLVIGAAGAWATFTPGEGSQPLDFRGPWATALAPGLGYAYMDPSGALSRVPGEGAADYVIAEGVTAAAVSPDGARLAFAQSLADGTTRISGYDVGLKSTYVLASEMNEVTDLSWAPSGNRIAYLRIDSSTTTLRVRNLTGAGNTTTVATGDLGQPVWLRDSDHILLAATVRAATGPVRKAFVINVAAPPSALTIGIGLPAEPTVDVTDPVPSPDGHQIAFISGSQVWLMNADGTRPTPLTRFDPDAFPYSCLMPAWTLA